MISAGAETVARFYLSALVFLVWDILITVDDEVRFIWSTSWTWMKIVYFFVRYVPVSVEASLLLIGTELTLQFHFTTHDCFIWQVYQGFSLVVVIIVVDYILLLRVYALYNAHFKLKGMIAALFVGEVISMAIGVGITSTGVISDALCSVLGLPSTARIQAIACFLFQGVLFGLTACKFVASLRRSNALPLMTLLMRDGTWAFFVIFGIWICNGLLFLFVPHPLAGALYGWLFTCYSCVGYRVLLNLQDLAFRSAAMHSSLTNIEFTSHILSGTEPSSSNSEGTYEMSPLSTAHATHMPPQMEQP